MAVERIQPPFKGLHPKRLRQLTSQVLFPVNVHGDRQYYMSVPAGVILEREVGQGGAGRPGVGGPGFGEC